MSSEYWVFRRRSGAGGLRTSTFTKATSPLPNSAFPKKNGTVLGHGLSWIFHAAAYLGFDEDQRAKSMLVNVDGTRNVLELAQSSGTHLFYISTAYVAGRSKDIVFERELKDPVPWRNPYEETKFLAEREVHLTCRKENLPYTVYRPAILMGDWSHGRTLKFRNVYYFMKLFHQLSKRKRKTSFLLKGNVEGKINLLPVDFAVQAIWNLSQVTRVRRKHIPYHESITTDTSALDLPGGKDFRAGHRDCRSPPP